MRNKLLLLFLLFLLAGSANIQPTLASSPVAHHAFSPAQFASQVDEGAISKETADSTSGLVIGLAGATLVIGLTAVGVFLNNRNKQQK